VQVEELSNLCALSRVLVDAELDVLGEHRLNEVGEDGAGRLAAVLAQCSRSATHSLTSLPDRSL